MIPEFINANPATKRTVSEAPPATESTSTGQLLNNDRFQKALEKQTTERTPQEHNLSDDESSATTPVSEARTESARPAAHTQRAATESDRIAESPDGSQPRDDSQPRVESQPTRQNQIAASDARDESVTLTRTESENPAQNSQSESDGSSRPILRIDQGTSTAAEPQSGNEQKTQTTVRRSVSTEDSNPGTLPSLARQPLDQVSVSQLPGDFVFDEVAANDATFGNPASLPAVPAVEDNLAARPFPGNALLQNDHHTNDLDFRTTSTEPSLNQNSVADADSLLPNILVELHDELPIPTLPSLRTDVESAAQIALELDAAAIQLSNGTAPGSTNGTEVSPAEVGAVSTVQSFDIQPRADVIIETTLPLTLEAHSPTETSNPETAPLVLPSLSTEVNRATLTSTSSPIQPIAPAEPSTPDSSTELGPSTSISVPSSASETAVAGNEAIDSRANQNVSTESDSAQRVVNAPQIRYDTTDFVSQTDNSTVAVPEQTAVTSGDVNREQRPQRATTESVTIEDRSRIESETNVSIRPPRENRQLNHGDAAPDPAPIATSSADAVAGGASEAVTPAVNSSSASSEREIRNQQVTRRPANPAAASIEAPSAAVSVENFDNEVRIETATQPVDESQSIGGKTASGSVPLSEPEHNQASRVPNREAPASREQVPASTSNPAANQNTPDEHRADTNAAATRRSAARLSGSASSETGTNELHDDGSVEQTVVVNQTRSAPAQSTQPGLSPSIQPGSVPETPAPESSNTSPVASASPVVEPGNAVASPATSETQTTNVATSGAASVSSQASSAPAVTPGTVSQASPVREPAVPMEIQDAVSAIQEATSGDGHIRVRLNPRELGNMLVDVSRVDGGIVARLEVESAAARVAVLDTLPDLQQSLSRSGATVDRIEVVLTDTRSEAGRQDGDQSQQRDQQQSRQDRQSSEQRQARDEQNQRRQQRDTSGSTSQEQPPEDDRLEELDIKL